MAVNIDYKMVAKVNVIIPDVRSISYMKVKAQLEPRGLRVTPDNLNVRGQVFKGTVQNNLIDGTFEVRHKRYDGRNAQRAGWGKHTSSEPASQSG